jgi:hypothetical protein
MTLIDFKKVIADEKISLNVSRRLVSPVCIAGVLKLRSYGAPHRTIMPSVRSCKHRRPPGNVVLHGDL